MKHRQSISPTYDHVEKGDRFTVETRVAGRRVSITRITDPFARQRLYIGWRDLLCGLLRRRLVIETIISGDSEIVEDVMELNADYLGTQHSSRRQEWNAGVQRALEDVAAQESEHES